MHVSNRWGYRSEYTFPQLLSQSFGVITAKILQAFNPEYISVTYPDAMSGTDETRQFYVGDRTAPYKCWWIGNQRMESVSFDIIEV